MFHIYFQVQYLLLLVFILSNRFNINVLDYELMDSLNKLLVFPVILFKLSQISHAFYILKDAANITERLMRGLFIHIIIIF